MMVSGSGVRQDSESFSFAGLAAFAELFLKRKLSFPVSLVCGAGLSITL